MHECIYALKYVCMVGTALNQNCGKKIVLKPVYYIHQTSLQTLREQRSGASRDAAVGFEHLYSTRNLLWRQTLAVAVLDAVGIDKAIAALCIPTNHRKRHALHRAQDGLLQGSKAARAVAAEVDLHAAPQVLDEAELTVELGKHENAVARLHDDFLEIWYYQIPSLNLVRLGKKLAFLEYL